ncbi:putative RNase H-like HicB family nuclease [Acinetobacter lwoffii]|jgi:predicted RNase H-like HicB family nuclease|uniref:RNase H-like HicB family nuclease n=1 Tax=Acinetobacter lwoffii TaxID=28090 RepID=A0AAW8LH37_ACILW|nr:HicB family protein [Acinetobacter lwoffii]MDR6630377.1 putative RNase H-like HicB family nuclease [Acinetobacter lwoffii]
MEYPILIKKTNNEYLVSSRDIPELNAIADNYDAALSEALDAFETALIIYRDDCKPIPKPSELQDGEVMLSLPFYLFNE